MRTRSPAFSASSTSSLSRACTDLAFPSWASSLTLSLARSYGERWFPGFRSERFENGTEWMSDAVPFRFLHQLPRNGRLTLPDNYTAPYVRDDLEAYLALLWETREETWDKLEWVCDQIPCRFEADEA